MAADPKKRPPPKRAPAPAPKVEAPPPPAEPVRFWIETVEKGDSPPKTTVTLKTAGGLESSTTIGTYAGACSGRALEGKVLYSFDCFDAGLGTVLDFKHVGDQLIVQYSEQWEEGDAPPPRALKKLALPAGQPLVYGKEAPPPAAAAAPAEPPPPAAAPPSLKIVVKKGHGAFDAIYGSKKSVLNLWNDGQVEEQLCFGSSTPTFLGVRTSVEMSGLPAGTQVHAELTGSTTYAVDDQGYYECNTKAMKALAKVSMDAPAEAGTQDIDILLSAASKKWPCEMKITVVAKQDGKVLSKKDGSMTTPSCPE